MIPSKKRAEMGKKTGIEKFTQQRHLDSTNHNRELVEYSWIYKMILATQTTLGENISTNENQKPVAKWDAHLPAAGEFSSSRQIVYTII